MNLARLGNKYLTDQEPWKKIKEDEDRVKTIMNIALQVCANLAIVAEPFLPFTAARMREMLNVAAIKWEDAGRGDLLASGSVINETEFLFEKIEDEAIQKQTDKLAMIKQENNAVKIPPEPGKPDITYEEFSRMDIRSGTITAAEVVPKTKKLLKLTIDTGIDVRTVVSGIAEFFTPGEIVGKRVSILVNLQPRELRGITSSGMILMAENPDGTLFFVSPEGDGIINGATIK
jgi:methionyl-tRNA synthetase